jgi:hypothetical protein
MFTRILYDGPPIPLMLATVAIMQALAFGAFA